MEQAYMEVIRRVVDEHGDWIEVGPDGDGLDLVEVRAPEAYGKVRFAMRPAFAKKLAEALVAAADEAGE